MSRLTAKKLRETARMHPGTETASCDAEAATSVRGQDGAGSEIVVGATFEHFVSFQQRFEAWYAEGRHVASTSESHKNIPPDLRDELRIVGLCTNLLMMLK